MSEIEKLYENAGVEKIYDCHVCPYVDCEDKCKVDMGTNYPYFTAEKQIELIKILAKGEVKINNEDGEYEFSVIDTISDFSSFEESLADLVNRMWQDLTEEEKQKIKEILE